MAWCEAAGINFVLGLAKNKRFDALSRAGASRHSRRSWTPCEPSRAFGDLTYHTRKTWRRTRRVVVKAEHSAKGANPRYVVTSLRQ